jgi:hypothetical protein
VLQDGAVSSRFDAFANTKFGIFLAFGGLCAWWASVTDVCTPRNAKRRSQQGDNCAITRDWEFRLINPGCATSIHRLPSEQGNHFKKSKTAPPSSNWKKLGGDVFTKSGQTTDPANRSRKKPSSQNPTTATTAKSSQIHVINMGADSREID